MMGPAPAHPNGTPSRAPAPAGREFQDVRVIGIDKDRSAPAGSDALWDVHLRLSSWVSGEWLRLFQGEWLRSLVEPKPRITAYTHRLVLHSDLDEVENHLPEISRVVGETNNRYREHLSQRGQLNAEREAREKLARGRLEELEKRLGFR